MSAEKGEFTEMVGELKGALSALNKSTQQGDHAQVWKTIREMGGTLERALADIENTKDRYKEFRGEVREDMQALEKTVHDAIAEMKKLAAHAPPAQSRFDRLKNGEAAWKAIGTLGVAIIALLMLLGNLMGVDVTDAMGK